MPKITNNIFVDEHVVMAPEMILERCEFHDCTFETQGPGVIIRDCELYYTDFRYPSLSHWLTDAWTVADHVQRLERCHIHFPRDIKHA